MNDAEIPANGHFGQLNEKDQIRFASTFAEFATLLQEAYGPGGLSQLAERTPSVARHTEGSSGIEMPSAPSRMDGENGNVYMVTKFLPYVEGTLIPSLRSRIARNKATAEARQAIVVERDRIIEECARLAKEIANLKRESDAIERHILLAQMSANETRQSSQLLH